MEDSSRVATKRNKKVGDIKICYKLAKLEDIALIRGKTTCFRHMRPNNNNNILDVTAQNLLMLYSKVFLM